MGKIIAKEKMADEGKKIKVDNQNIANHESLDKNEIDELVQREANLSNCFINLFLKILENYKKYPTFLIYFRLF